MPFLRDKLHWLQVLQRVKYKCCMWVYKSLHGQEPIFIQQFCTNITEGQWRTTLRLRTHNHLILPRSKSKFGKRPFSAARPSMWNSLLDVIKTSLSLTIFKNRLKLICSGRPTTLDIVKQPSLWQYPCNTQHKRYHFSFAVMLYKLLDLLVFICQSHTSMIQLIDIPA